MTTDITHTATPEPEALRAALVEEIRGQHAVRTAQVEAAFRAVPRHVFLPGIDLQTAYSGRVVVTKRGADGAAISSASHPSIVAAMLEQLDVRSGHRVLEIGTGTGINAALLAELAGPTGHVVTIDIDDDVVTAARRGLSAAGYHHVEVICADGADGHALGAPYDRIIVTAGAWDVAASWWQQLAVGGRLVVPLRLHGSGLTRSLAFDHLRPDQMVSTSAQVCGFVAMRGSTAYPERNIRLADGITIHLDHHSPVDDAAFRQVLSHPRHERWTGVIISPGEPVEHLDLWLATTSTNGFGRLFAGPQARQNCLVTPAPRWSGAAVHDDANLTYLTVRPNVGGTTELGVISHGPASGQLAAHTVEHLQAWDRRRPAQPLITAQPTTAPGDQLPTGHRVEKPNTRLSISW